MGCVVVFVLTIAWIVAVLGLRLGLVAVSWSFGELREVECLAVSPSWQWKTPLCPSLLLCPSDSWERGGVCKHRYQRIGQKSANTEIKCLLFFLFFVKYVFLLKQVIISFLTNKKKNTGRKTTTTTTKRNPSTPPTHTAQWHLASWDIIWKHVHGKH